MNNADENPASNMQLELLDFRQAVDCTNPPVLLTDNFLGKEEANVLLHLSRNAPWQRNDITMRGLTFPVPRDEVMFGDDEQFYKYSGVTIQSVPWPGWAERIQSKIESATGFRFPVVIGNRYHTGKDWIGWHADKNKVMGLSPAIASISLGGTRRFSLRHNVTKKVFNYELTHGSLLLMQPGCQEQWQHCIRKTSREVDERINWTFRPWIKGK